MIKNSSILKWTHNNRNHHSKGVVREWLHPPDALQRGHIAYLVKFLGNTEVDQAKGIDVVKEGIRKLKFTSQLRKSEGAKTPKVELTISIDGVAIQEPKTKRILHQYPLHRISYCADDKAEKKFFSFIAKEADSDKHVCFVFVSDKLAEEITLTIGQAFDLAYRRFLESSGRDLEMRKQLMILQKKIQDLETENDDLKRRIGDLQMLKDRQDVDSYKLDHGIADLCVVNGGSKLSDNDFSDDLSKPSAAPAALSSPIYTVPSRKSPKEEVKTPLSPSQELFLELGPTLPTVGTKLENLDLDDFEDFNPRGTATTTNGNMNNRRAPLNADSKPGSATIFEPAPVPLLQPPRTPTTPTICLSNGSHSGVTPPPLPLPRGKDLFGAEPFVPRTSVAATATAGVVAETPTLNDANDGSSGDQEDPFGMGDFGEVPTHLGAQELESAIGDLDKRLSEMRDGFSRGISFGNEDFSLESLDPLNNKQAMV